MIAATLTWDALPLAEPPRKTATMSDAAPADEVLVRTTLAGDEAAFSELIRRHKGRVCGTCSRFARDPQQLEDLAQEVFLRAWRKLGHFRGDAPFEHWLARLTTTTCYDFLRRERRHRENVSLDAFPIEMRDAGIDAAIAAGHAKELLDWAMLRLSAEERLILTLLEIEERSVREIAAQTGWSESNVKVRAFRAREKLKVVLSKANET
jgi:RNA polymerase sigma-70 factor (ECF subfamily)